MMHIFLAVLLGLILAPDAAHAGPVFMAALSAGASVGSAFAATTLGSFLTTTVIGKLLTSVAMSALAQALQSKPSSQPPGIKTTTTQAGGTNPGQFILGRYATGGYAVAPAMSHGDAGRTPNAYLTYVIEVSDLPVTGLDGIIIDGIPCTLGATPHADYGLPVQGDFLDRAWVKFYAGTQTAADPMLLAKYGSYPERPWTADMVGTGIAYAIVTFQYDREVFDSLPAVRFVVDGLKLYDPRKDSTVGGSGTHRWSNPATWAFTNNPVVMIYNIMRGITLPDGSIWGGNFAAADLPLVNWFAAMNVCDAPVTEGGETVARFRAGLEVSVGDEPAQVIEELLKACSGQIVDMGGTWKIRAGGPGLPVLFVTDEDVIATRPEDFDPFPGLSETYNGITATYPEPKALWEAKEAAPIYNSAWEAEDGVRRLVANLQFAAVTSHRQARNLMRSAIKDHRRMRRHNLALAPFAMGLEPLDVVAWTSSRNGYAAKAFELGQVVDDLGAGVPLPQIAIREVDPSDFDPNLLDDAPLSLPPGRVVRPAAQTVPGFAVEAVTLQDAGGADRRPALRLTWTADGLADVEAIEWEVRRTGTTALVNDGSTTNVASGKRTISAGILPATAYQARARFVVGRARSWTAWVDVTTLDVRLSDADFSIEVRDALDEARVVREAALAEVEAARAEAQAAVEAARAEARFDLEVEIPRMADTEAALEAIANQVAWLTARGASTDGMLADAGLYIDPATGKARLEGVAQLDGKLNEVSVTLDAAQAQLALRVTQADVDLAIAAAQLDPAELPIIGALNGRVTDLEVSLDAAEAAIEQRATVIDFTALDTTVTNAVTRIDGLEAEIVLRVDQTTFEVLQTRVTNAEVTLGAMDGAGLTISLSDIRQRVDAFDGVTDAALADIASLHDQNLARLADAALVRQEYHALVDDERVARASLRTELAAAIDQNAATIVSEQLARASADSALAGSITALQATTGENAAAITAEALARTDADSALSSQITALTATVGDNTAAITAEAIARSDGDTALSSQITTVSAVANSRNRIYRQNTAPSSPVTGDLWFDTANGNLAKRWNGSNWVNTDDTRISQNAAAITNEAIARADADSALSSQISTVSSSVGSLSATVSTQATALTTLQGNASASLVMRSRAGGAEGEIEVVAASNPSGAASSAVVIRSDRMQFIGDLAMFGGELKSTGYVAGSSGWRITQGGNAEFNGVVTSRNIVVNSGQFTHTGTLSNNSELLFVNSGIRIGKDDTWAIAQKAFVAVAVVTSTVSGPGGLDGTNTFWGLECALQHGARWLGYSGNPQPSALWQQDPATLVTPAWASGNDQRIFFRIKFTSVGGAFAVNPLIKWKIFEVT